MELGRAIEEKKENDLVRWEAMYGDSTAAQTPVSETHKAHSMKKEFIEANNSVEMTSRASSNETVADKDTIENRRQHEVDSIEIEKNEVAQGRSLKATECAAEPDDLETTIDKDSGLSSEPSQVPSCVMSLPFKIPHLESKPRNGDDDDDDRSIQAIVDDADTASVRTSKRLSAASLFRRLSYRNHIGTRSRLVQSDSNEMLVPTSPSNSAASSQGIVDSEAGLILEESQSIEMEIHLHDDAEPTSNEDHEKYLAKGTGPDDPQLNTSSNLVDEIKDVKTTSDDTVQFENETKTTVSIEEKRPTEAEQVEEGLGIVSKRRRHTIDGVTSILPIKVLSLAPVRRPPSKIIIETTSEKDANAGKPAALSSSKSKSKAPKKEMLTSEVVKELPSHLSPVVISYRTNEWAKHLSHADAPELEPLAEPVADTENSISPEDIEIAAPLNMEELKQTALMATIPPPNGKRVSHSENFSCGPVQGPTSDASGHSASDANLRQLVVNQSLTASPLNPTPEIVACGSLPTLHTPNCSSPPTGAKSGGLRSVSSPYLSRTAALSPIEKAEARYSAGHVIAEGPFSLMAQREKMLQARLSSISLTRESWAPRTISRHPIIEEGHQSRPGSPLSLVEDDDMPLTQRRALLQQKAMFPPMGMDVEARRSPIDPRNSISRFSRETNKPKAATMAAWRESLQEDMTKHMPLLEVDIAQNELMEQQRRAQVARSQRIIASENLDKSIAERMRHGDMQDLHREAMRRMQATANRRTTNSP